MKSKLTEKKFWEQILNLVKTAEKNNEKQFGHLMSFWQPKEGQLISADALYQMVDLCDDNDD